MLTLVTKQVMHELHTEVHKNSSSGPSYCGNTHKHNTICLSFLTKQGNRFNTSSYLLSNPVSFPMLLIRFWTFSTNFPIFSFCVMLLLLIDLLHKGQWAVKFLFITPIMHSRQKQWEHRVHTGFFNSSRLVT